MLFITDCPEYYKAIKAQKLLIIAGKSGKILPAVSSERTLFHKMAENKAASIQNWKVGRPFHLFLKKQT